MEIHKPSEQLILDLNSLASGEEFLQLGDFSISPDQRWLAYSLDTQGDETYRLFLLSLDDMQTQELSRHRCSMTRTSVSMSALT